MSMSFDDGFRPQRSSAAVAPDDEFDALLDSQPWGTIALDARHDVLFATPGAARLLRRRVVAGVPLAELLPQLADDNHDAGLREALEQGVELQIDDRWLWLKQTTVVGSERIAATLSLFDVTDMRRAVDDRVESLRFLSHDLRSPTNSIVALTQLHEHDPNAFEECGGIQRVADLARYALSLGDQFIFTSVAGALQRGDFARFDLRGAVRNLIPQLDVAAVYRNVPLRLWLAEGSAVWVSGVRVFVIRALQNLIDNAIQASPAGAPVTVSLKVMGDSAVITVSDEAGGLPGLVDEAIYDFDALAQRSASGFGLGLKLAARIVRLHDGTLNADRNAKGGTDFAIRLPCLAVQRGNQETSDLVREYGSFATTRRPL
ncbi:HAMP domain-containing sensor histidine kinase [Paraburkholderia sediminicola]